MNNIDDPFYVFIPKMRTQGEPLDGSYLPIIVEKSSHRTHLIKFYNIPYSIKIFRDFRLKSIDNSDFSTYLFKEFENLESSSNSLYEKIYNHFEVSRTRQVIKQFVDGRLGNKLALRQVKIIAHIHVFLEELNAFDSILIFMFSGTDWNHISFQAKGFAELSLYLIRKYQLDFVESFSYPSNSRILWQKKTSNFPKKGFSSFIGEPLFKNLENTPFQLSNWSGTTGSKVYDFRPSIEDEILSYLAGN